ncbi:MAG: zinc ribbon domain-containing protein [Acidobacteria bacterium]|nr:MAG: zinc ribbon domain-containing protein [Acidobacteriota bacterium]
MPLYEYRCEDCEHRFEVLQAVGADGRDLLCPCCGERHLSRLLSSFATGGDAGREAALPLTGCCRGTPT